MIKNSTLLFFLLLFGVQGIADTIPDLKAIETSLVKKGYENITVFGHTDTVFVGATNRLYRWDPQAYADMMELIVPHIDHKTTICLAVLAQGIPMLIITMQKSTWTGCADGSVSRADFTASVHTYMKIKGLNNRAFLTNGANPSFNKLDFVIYPQIKLQLGNFDDPFESQFNIAPAVEISFLRGMNLMAQVIIPLQNDFGTAGNSVRPGIISLSQIIRFPKNFFWMVSAGYFTRNRYGFNGEVRKFLMNGKIALGFTGGITGYAALIDKQWAYTGIDRFTWFADASYRWAKFDLTLKAGYGGFIDGKTGWRVDVSRQFREVSIGFFALETDGFLNGGFNFSIPLPPRRYGTKHVARIRPESYFSWEYRAKGLSESGRFFSTGSDLTKVFQQINPDYMQKQISGKLYGNMQFFEKK